MCLWVKSSPSISARRLNILLNVNITPLDAALTLSLFLHKIQLCALFLFLSLNWVLMNSVTLCAICWRDCCFLKGIYQLSSLYR